MKKLTALAVAKISKPGRYAVGNGAYLQITGANGRSWIFRYERGGRGYHVGLGPCALVSLAEAREKALVLRRLLLDGVAPLDHRRAERARAALEAAQGTTFRQCAEGYISAHEAGWRSPIHLQQWKGSLETYVFPTIGALPVASIDTALVLGVLEPLWGVKTETASRIRGRIEMVLDWAKVRGFRSGDNPARWRGHLDNLLPHRRKVAAVEHFVALPYGAVPEFMRELRTHDSIVARALEFIILTSARVGEAAGARWDEISGDVWVVPGTRMKSGKPHRVPLTPRVQALLAALPRTGDLVFPGSRSGRRLNNSVLRKLLATMGRADITVHGFRSSFRDWAAERTNYPNHVVEMALAHAIPSGVEAAYRRGDLFEQRARLMREWDRYCSRAAAPIGAVVTPLRRRDA